MIGDPLTSEQQQLVSAPGGVIAVQVVATWPGGLGNESAAVQAIVQAARRAIDEVLAVEAASPRPLSA